MELADETGLDLVEVAPDAEPPVCKLLDFGKYKYEAQKKASEARKKQKTIDIKEVKFRPGIDAADYDVKLRNIRRFLDEGDKVKVTMRFRGRRDGAPEYRHERADARARRPRGSGEGRADAEDGGAAR